MRTDINGNFFGNRSSSIEITYTPEIAKDSETPILIGLYQPTHNYNGRKIHRKEMIVGFSIEACQQIIIALNERIAEYKNSHL